MRKRKLIICVIWVSVFVHFLVKCIYWHPKQQHALKVTLEEAALNNRYCKIEKRLGNGTFGTVWQCKTPSKEPFAKDHPKIAVKFMYHLRTHAQREVDILKNLKHM